LFGLVLIEKDYFVTEALRMINQSSSDKVIFKGGTSLSKGWNIIQRFSEDVDIFFDPTPFEYEDIKNDYDKISREHFDATYIPLQDMCFQKSDRLFVPSHLEPALQTNFEQQCRILCSESFPTWKQVIQRFYEIRELL